MRNLPVNPLLLCVSFLTVWTAAALEAQDDRAVSLTSTFVHDTGNGAVAEGGDWRANFMPATVEFLPALGECAPRTAPVTFQLLDHGRGDRRHAATAVVPTVAGQRVRYARGALEERYDARRDGLELSVRFEQRPEGPGDLTVRYRIDTWLPVAQRTSTKVRWADAHGGVQLGSVTGIDARGAFVEGALALHDDVLSLSLPAAFVDAAQYPMVLDPLIGTVLVVASGNVDSQPAAAFDETSQRYLVCWRRTFSATQSVIRGQLLSTTGSPVGSFFPINPAAPQSFVSWRPSVAARQGEFYVAWSGGVSAFLIPNAYATRVSSNGVVTAESQLLPQSGDIDIACSPATNLVRFATNSGAGSSHTGNLLWNGSNLVAVITASAGDSASALSRDGAPSSLLLAEFSATDLGVRSADGTGPTNLATQVSGGAISNIALAMTDATHGVLVWDQLQTSPTATTRSDIKARAFHWAGAVQGVVFDSQVLDIAADPLLDEQRPTVVALGSKYGVAWQQAGANGDIDVVYRDVSPGCIACGSLTQIDAVGTLGVQPVLVGKTTSGLPDGEGLLIAVQTPGLFPTGGGLVAKRVIRFVGGAIVEAGPGCGFAGTFDTTGGPAALGNANFTYRLTGFPATALTFFALGLPGGEMSCGLCTFTNPMLIQYVAPSSASEVRLTLPIPCNANLLGLPLAAQWLLAGAASSPCGFVPNLAASRRLHATLGQ